MAEQKSVSVTWKSRGSGKRRTRRFTGPEAQRRAGEFVAGSNRTDAADFGYRKV